MVLNNLIRDEQPDAQTGSGSDLLPSSAIEPLKDFLLLCFRDANAEILDADRQALSGGGEMDDDLLCLR